MKEREDNVGWTEALLQWAHKYPKDGSAFWTILYTDEEGQEQELRVSTMENRLKAQVEQMVRRGAQSAIRSMEQIDRQEADAMRGVYMDEFGLGYYNWCETGIDADKNRVNRFMATIPGHLSIMTLLIKRCDEKFTQQRLEALLPKINPAEFLLAYRWALGNLPPPPNQEGTSKKSSPEPTMSD